MSQPHKAQQPQKVTLSQLARQTSSRGLTVISEYDEDLARRLQRMRGTRPDKPTVVVVGEAKRGKSSLTNAVINVPGLSPVDARVATSTYIVFRRGPQTAARALLPGRDEPIDVPLEHMRDWATDLGNRGEYTPPRLIEVECNSPLLGNVNLVDTPGVGGLDASHAEIALRAIGRATALLFVCDASAPFTKPELDFLLKASETVDLVIFAVTKIDAYRGWRQIVEDNRELLRKHAPRFADAAMLPVSAKLFEQAAQMGTSDLAVALRQESNIIQLQITLQQHVAAKAAALHEANLLRTMRSQLTGLSSTLEESRRSTQPDLEYANRLKENRDRLMAQRKADSRSWQLRLRSQLSRARLDTMADIGAEVRRAQGYWRAQIEEVDKGRLDQLAPYLDAALKATSGRIFDRQQARLRNVTTSVLQSMFAERELAEVYAALQRPYGRAAMMGPRKREMAMDEKIMTGMGMMGAVSMSSLVGHGLASVAVGVVAWPVAVAVGIGAGGWILWARRAAAERNHMKIWLNETLAESRGKMEAEASAYFIEAEQELTLALDRALVRRIDTLDNHIKEIDNAMKVDRGERERRAAAITKKIGEVKDINATIDILLPRLRNAVVASKAKATAAPDKVKQAAAAAQRPVAPAAPAFLPTPDAPAPPATTLAAPTPAVAPPAPPPIKQPDPHAPASWQSHQLPPR